MRVDLTLRTVLNTDMAQRKKRRKLWQLPPNSLCSVLGSGLSIPRTRSILRNAGVSDVHELSDYQVHQVAIEAGRHPGPIAKALHRNLEEAHRAMVLKYQRIWDTASLQEAWKADYHQHLASALWAVMTHGAATPALQNTAISDAHMKGHEIRASDPEALAQLESELQSLKQALDGAEKRAALSWAAEKEDLLRRLQKSEAHRLAAERQAQRLAKTFESFQAEQSPQADLQEKLGRAEARIESLETQLRSQSRMEVLPELRTKSALPMVEAMAAEECGHCPNQASCDLGGCTVLYVGGERSMLPHLKRLAQAANAELLHHDGGREDKLANLPRLCARADIVMFPLDRVGHAAVTHIKRACDQASKRFLPLRRASVGAFEEGLALAAA